jgi:phosphonate transport system substrate-binding protein
MKDEAKAVAKMRTKGGLSLRARRFVSERASMASEPCAVTLRPDRASQPFWRPLRFGRLLFWLCGMLIALGGCAHREQAMRIDLDEVEQISTIHSPAQESASTLRVAISSMISPNDTRLLYRELVDYVGEKLGREVVFKQRRTYAEVNELIAQGELDLAFICSAPYVEAHDKFDAQILAVPVVRGETVYRSYTIVRAGSGIDSLKQLRGKRFAFVDPMSNTGYLVPKYWLVKLGESPDSFFSSYTYTDSHDNSMQAVTEGFADGAAVDSLVYDFLQSRGSDLVRNTRIIQRSEPFGIPPFVVPQEIEPGLQSQLEQIFWSMHEDPRGKTILQKLAIDKFVPGENNAYDSIRRMRAVMKASKPRPSSSPPKDADSR